MAVTAVVCGVVALVLCWIPLVNLLAILAGLGGVVLGVLALLLARRGLHGGPRRSALGAAASALALAVALVVDIVYVVQLSDQGVDVSAPPARPAPSVSAPVASPSAAPGDVSPSDAPVAPPASAPAAAPAQALTGLTYGTTATVGDHTVTVAGVNTNGDAAMAEANQFNKPPGDRYVIADLSVVYNGTEEGIPWAQLQAAFQGTDARDYSSGQCSAVVPRSGFQQPNLRQGGASEYQVCFDVPPGAIAGGAVQIKQFVGEPATWAVAG